MKRILKYLLATVLFPFLGWSQASNYSNGAEVDSLVIEDQNGTIHNLYNIATSGKWIMICVFDVDGASNQNSFQYFNDLYEKYGCNAGDLYCIAVSNGTDSATDVNNFVTNYGGGGVIAPVVVEQEGTDVKNNLGVSNYPTFCLIGSDKRMKNNDIWPVASLADLESGFPSGFTPTAQACAPMSTAKNELLKMAPYPNPTQDELRLTFEAPYEKAEISIYNLQGQLIRQKELVGVANYNLSLVELPEGVYQLNILTDKGKASYKINKI